MQNIILSERQKPRALRTMKEVYAEHKINCVSSNCELAKNLRKEIETLENELGDWLVSELVGVA